MTEITIPKALLLALASAALWAALDWLFKPEIDWRTVVGVFAGAIVASIWWRLEAR